MYNQGPGLHEDPPKLSKTTNNSYPCKVSLHFDLTKAENQQTPAKGHGDLKNFEQPRKRHIEISCDIKKLKLQRQKSNARTALQPQDNNAGGMSKEEENI